MTSDLVTVGSLAVAGTTCALLGYAAAGHAAHLDRFVATIASHGVVGPRRAPAVGVAVTVVEAAVAVALVAEAVAGTARPALSLVASTAVFAGFAAYLAAAARRVGDGGIDCGCVGGHTVTRWAWLRPAGLSLLTIAAALVPATVPGDVDVGRPARLLTVAAAWTLATAAVALTEARHVSASWLAEAKAAYRLRTAVPSGNGRRR